MGGATLDDKMKSGDLKIDGNADKVKELFAMLDNFELMFNIVTP